MKTTTIFSIALSTAMMLSASNIALGQRYRTNDQTSETSRTSRRGQSESTATSRSNNSNKEDKKVTNSDNNRSKYDREGNDRQTYGNQGRDNHNNSNNGNHYGWGKQKDKNHNGNDGNRDWEWKERDRHDNHDHYGYHRDYDHHHVVYRNRLPAERYNRYVFGGREFYHCDGRFFRFQPNYGYVQIDCPYTIVDVLPRVYIFRNINGQPVIFSRGFYYLPVAYGWMVVPEPESPQLSFNIYIGR